MEKSIKNDHSLFPLNLERLKIYARRWVNENPETLISAIKLYRYSSHFARILQKQHMVKYCIVFDIAGEILPETKTETAPSRIDKVESFNRSIYDILEYHQTISNQDSYGLLMDAGFSDVYHNKPDKNFKDDWVFLTGRLAEGNPSVMDKERYWVLFDAANTTEAEQNRPNVRKAVVLEAAKSIRKTFPNLTQKQAAAKINEWLEDNKFVKYSEKHLIKIIKDLKFKPRKPGKPPKR